MTSLIISADDYAQSAAIDNGIIALIQQGRITAASCLTLSPRWFCAAKQLDEEVRACADIGLHLDFTQYPQHVQYPLTKLIMKAVTRSLPTKLIYQSIQTQLDRFEDALGVPPDYIDGHQHVHQLPQIREALLEVVCQRYPSQQPWIRIAKPPLTDGIKGMIIRALGANALATKATQSGLRHNQFLLGVYAFDGDIDGYFASLDRWLKLASGRHVEVLMCHPAMIEATNPGESLSTAGSAPEDAIYAARLREYEVLASHEFLSLLAKYGITLVRGSSLSIASAR